MVLAQFIRQPSTAGRVGWQCATAETNPRSAFTLCEHGNDLRRDAA